MDRLYFIFYRLLYGQHQSDAFMA